jgi:glycosyltransferase involved in cell wall biosynthesis
MFLGRLEDETGIMEYLKALKILNDKTIALNLDVYGDGSLLNEAREFASQNKLRVSFKGFVFNATDFIKDYKYVFVSRYLGILEAMAAARPVFAQFNIPIKKDYLEMAPFAGYISISKDGEQIAKSVENFINKQSNIDVQSAYGWVKDKTWENMVNQYLKLWLS